jgi:hypothetical protein
MCQVRDQRACRVENLRPDGNGEHDALAIGAVAVGTLPVPSATGTKRRPAAKRRKVSQVRVGDEGDVSAPAAVAAVGTALRHVLLAAEADRAVPAAPCERDEASPIREHRARRR